MPPSIDKQSITAAEWISLMASDPEGSRIALFKGRFYTKIDPNKAHPKNCKVVSFNDLIKQTRRLNLGDLNADKKNVLKNRLVCSIQNHSKKLHQKGRIKRNLIRLTERIRNWRQHFKTSIGLAKEFLEKNKLDDLPDFPVPPTPQVPFPEGDLSKKGIKNLGCTCYMNSALQLLEVIPEFREALEQTDEPTPFQEYLNGLLADLENKGKPLSEEIMTAFYMECEELGIVPQSTKNNPGFRVQFDPVEWIQALTQKITPDYPLSVSNQGIDIPHYLEQTLTPQAVWDHNPNTVSFDLPPRQLIQQINRNRSYGGKEKSLLQMMRERVEYCRLYGGAAEPCNEVLAIINSYPKPVRLRENGCQFLYLYQAKQRLEKNASDEQKEYIADVFKNFNEEGQLSFFEHVQEQIGDYEYGEGESRDFFQAIRNRIQNYPHKASEDARQVNFLRQKLNNLKGPVYDYIRKQLYRDFTGQTKDKTPFDFTQNLQVKNPFAPEQKTYQAKAVILHRGEGPRSGHYMALMRQGQKWWLYNDTQISLAKDENDEEFKNLQDYQQQSFAVLWEQVLPE